MTQKHKISLGEVQETLLIPLYGRAVETRKEGGLLHDAKAVEMVDAIDYDFARLDGGRSLLGSALRTLIFDVWVRRFLDDHPSGTVVDIGSGLNTRFERLDNGRLHWVDLDLPDVMALRRRFFVETDRRRMLAMSVLDAAWVEAVKNLPGPYFFVAEAVLIYLEETEVRSALGLITENFPDSHVALDTAGSWIVANQHRHDTMKKMQARMSWGCDDPGQLERWGLGARLLESRDLSQLPRQVRPQVPLRYRLMLPVVRVVRPKAFAKYKVNLFEMERR